MQICRRNLLIGASAICIPTSNAFANYNIDYEVTEKLSLIKNHFSRYCQTSKKYFPNLYKNLILAEKICHKMVDLDPYRFYNKTLIEDTLYNFKQIKALKYEFSVNQTNIDIEHIAINLLDELSQYPNINFIHIPAVPFTCESKYGFTFRGTTRLF